MGDKEKIIRKIYNYSSVSFDEAEKLLLNLGFNLHMRGSHHIFKKAGFELHVSLKKRPELLT